MTDNDPRLIFSRSDVAHGAQVASVYQGASNQTQQSRLTAAKCNSISLTHPLQIMSSDLCARTMLGAALNPAKMRLISDLFRQTFNRLQKAGQNMLFAVWSFSKSSR